MPEPLPELMTVAEIAAILKVNQQTVRNWIDAGRIPHLRVGERRVRVFKRDFDAFVAESYDAPVVEPALTIWDGNVADPVTAPRTSRR